MSNHSNSLYHFGIFGMKWGVRRYQNEDGTLTEEGKKRYSQRSEQLEGAKYHVAKKIREYARDAEEWTARAKEFRKQSIDKSIEQLYGDKKTALEIEGDMDRVKNAIEENAKHNEHHVQLARELVEEQKELLKKLSNTGIDVLKSDREYRKQLEDLVANGDVGLLKYLEVKSMYRDIEEYSKQPKTAKTTVKSNKNLSQRFSDAQKDNPKLTYDQIYKEMKVDLNSDDPDVYKQAEAEWLKKHGY